MCQFWQATRLMVQDWHRVNQPLGATEFSCFHVKIFPEDEESVIGTDSTFCSTLSCWSAGVIGTMSSLASDGSLESLESGGSLFLIHIHVIMPSSIRTFHRTNLKNNQYGSWNTCQWNPIHWLALQSSLLLHLQQFHSLSNHPILTPEIKLAWKKITIKLNST